MVTFRACIARINSPERYAKSAQSVFPVYIRTESSTIEDAIHTTETAFGLDGTTRQP